jgi:hypothetical protein
MSAKNIHLALSVEIDRFNDTKIERDYLVSFRSAFGCTTVAEVRERCAAARAEGLVVFPPCDNHAADGRCLGHEVNDEEELVAFEETRDAMRALVAERDQLRAVIADLAVLVPEADAGDVYSVAAHVKHELREGRRWTERMLRLEDSMAQARRALDGKDTAR